MVLTAKEFAEEYGMSEKAAAETLDWYAEDPSDEAFDTVRKIMEEATGIIEPPPPVVPVVPVVVPVVIPEEVVITPPAEEPLIPTTPSFMSWILEGLLSVGDFFYSIFLETSGWIWPFHFLSSPFYNISMLFYGLVIDFSEFFSWLRARINEVAGLFSWTNIRLLILGWLPDLEKVIYWWQNWWSFVDDRVSGWFNSNIDIIKTWINEATQGVWSILDILDAQLSNLQSSWANFNSKIPTIDAVISWWSNWQGYIHTYIDTWWTSTMGEVQSLIESNIKSYFPFYDDLVRLWGSIKEFFSDPEDWLYKSMDRIVERFW